MSERKILFVINPTAGIKKKINIPELIKNNFRHSNYSLAVSSSFSEFEEIKKRIISESYTDIIACGGDGTVNRAAAFAGENNLVLGILPLGSGNGLARSVGISMKLEKALEQIQKGYTKKIDVGLLNGRPFFCAAGLGFDSHISHLFEKTKHRGLLGYTLLIAREYFFYKPETYSLKFNQLSITRPAMLVACCNSGQYGNDFYVAPTARMNDGKITISLVKPFPWIVTPYIVWKVLRMKANKLKKIETYESSEFIIYRQQKGYVHLDGEPVETGPEIHIGVKPLALTIICG